MATTNSQDFLFDRIKEMLPEDVSMVEAVSEILNVSIDSTYRRIRGETPLILEEAKLLCDHFQISLDKLLSIKSGYTLFQTDRIQNSNFSFERYMMGILDQLKQLDRSVQKEIIYLSKDLPFFHNFLSEPLFAFHYFFWMKSIVRHPDFENRHFMLDCLTPEIKKIGAEILHTYNNIPSTEIWNTECVNSIIFQVEAYKEAGLFSSDKDIAIIYDAVDAVINHLKNQAEAGCKYLPGENPELKINNFNFLYNRMTLGDNTIMGITDHSKVVFLNYDVMNYMSTRDESFCNGTYSDLKALIRRSTLISISGEKQRNIFFNILSHKIADRKLNLSA